MNTQLPGNLAASPGGGPGEGDVLELSLAMPSASPSNPKGVLAPATEEKTTTPLVLHHEESGGPPGSVSGWFPDAGVAGGFVHPWSLAARQQKVAFEHRPLLDENLGRPPPPPSDIISGPQPTPVVGWPPVRSTRKNLAGPRPSKTGTAATDGKEPKKPKTDSEQEEDEKHEAKQNSGSSMFVKVNMEGLAVGRKIDLLAHDGYQSLSLAVRTMFDNFLPGKSSPSFGRGGELEECADLVLLYEDNEGDKMLVGDVPWKMFVGSVRRLYITYRTRRHRIFPVHGIDIALREENV